MAMDEGLLGFFGPEEDEEVSAGVEQLPPENDEGNIEYKLKLVNPSKFRFEHLVTQMKWRLEEGEGKAIYQIGVQDNGVLRGLTDEEMTASLATLSGMCESLTASMSIIKETIVHTGSSENGEQRKVCEVLVRKIPHNMKFRDVRIAVIGPVCSGKSTLLGTLISGGLDNGHGQARLMMFRHLHEIQSGRTSSRSQEILGFDNEGKIVNYGCCRTAEEICNKSSKLITFLDLGGDERYRRTTLYGLTGHYPDACLLVVSANRRDLCTTAQQHLGLAMALDVPVVVVINKLDLVTSLESIIESTKCILESAACVKVPVVIENEDDVLQAATALTSDNVTPIFTISCVTGEGLHLFHKFLRVLPSFERHHIRDELNKELPLFEIDSVYEEVPDIGLVVGGTVTKGVIGESDCLLIGPSDTGQFVSVTIRSIHCNRSACRLVHAGQAATLALGSFNAIPLRKGMVVIDSRLMPKACKNFVAEVQLFCHPSAVIEGSQCTVYIGNVRQTCIVKKMEKEKLFAGESCRVCFSFVRQPEYVNVGSRLLMHERQATGIGEVMAVTSNNGTGDTVMGNPAAAMPTTTNTNSKTTVRNSVAVTTNSGTRTATDSGTTTTTDSWTTTATDSGTTTATDRTTTATDRTTTTTDSWTTTATDSGTTTATDRTKTATESGTTTATDSGTTTTTDSGTTTTTDSGTTTTTDSGTRTTTDSWTTTTTDSGTTTTTTTDSGTTTATDSGTTTGTDSGTTTTTDSGTRTTNSAIAVKNTISTETITTNTGSETITTNTGNEALTTNTNSGTPITICGTVTTNIWTKTTNSGTANTNIGTTTTYCGTTMTNSETTTTITNKGISNALVANDIVRA